MTDLWAIKPLTSMQVNDVIKEKCMNTVNPQNKIYMDNADIYVSEYISSGLCTEMWDLGNSSQGSSDVTSE